MRFYVNYKGFRLTVFDFIDTSKIIYDINEAIAYNGTIVLLLALHVCDYSEFEQIIIARAKLGKKSKVIMDQSWEELNDVELEKSHDREYMKYLDPLNDVMIVYNRTRDYKGLEPITKIKSQPVNFHAVDAYVKCILRDHPRNLSLVKDRCNGANLLVGKIKTRFARFLTTYYFYKYGLLDSGVMGINALTTDIEGMMKMHTEYNDIEYYNKIIQHLGPADNTDIVMTNEGITANDGWPFDSTIFERSSVTYVCETIDIDSNKNPAPFIITEKFYRAIVNKHPFIIQANPKQLEFIKHLGYKTFDSIIDESYNDYTDVNFTHVEPAVKAAKDLINKIPHNIDKVQEIVDYNFSHFLSECKKDYDTLLQAIDDFAQNNLQNSKVDVH